MRFNANLKNWIFKNFWMIFPWKDSLDYSHWWMSNLAESEWMSNFVIESYRVGWLIFSLRVYTNSNLFQRDDLELKEIEKRVKITVWFTDPLVLEIFVWVVEYDSFRNIGPILQFLPRISIWISFFCRIFVGFWR